MKHIKKFNEGIIDNHPDIGKKYICTKNYIGTFTNGTEYEVYKVENNLGDIMWYLKNLSTGRRISDWGLKSYELNIHFREE